MDFSKLSQNEKLATYGAIAVIVGGLVGFGAAGLGVLAILAAAAVLIVVFLPQFSPHASLPGSRGTLLLVLGAIAAVVLVLGLLQVLSALGFLLQFAAVPTIFYLLAVAGGLIMAWAGWQEFQAEGGKFQLGGTTRSAPGQRTDAATTPGTTGSTATAGTTGTTGTGTGTSTTGTAETTGTTTTETTPPPATTDEERHSQP